MNPILLTGYGGFLGREILRQLLDAGYHVRGLARQRYPELESSNVDFVVCDISKRAQVLRACEGCDAIIHTAAIAGVWGPWNDYYQINTAGTSHLIEGAVKFGAKAFIYTSSPSVTFAATHQSGVDESVPYPRRWLCAYPHTKALAEQAVLDAARRGAILACSLRPHLIWGNGDPHLFPRILARAKSRRLRRIGSGKNLIDVVHVRNAARAHLLALEKLLLGDPSVNAQAFFITDNQPTECWHWISQVLTTAGMPIPSRTISFGSAYWIGAVLERLHTLLRIRHEPPMTRFVAAQLALDHYFSIEKARCLLGYAPDVDREREFSECRPWLRELASK